MKITLLITATIRWAGWQRFRRVMGYQQLWMLEAKLKELAEEERIDGKSKVA